MKRGELFYYLFFVMLLFAKGIGWYDGMPAFKVCLVAAVLCVLMKICLTEHTLGQYLMMAAVVGLGGLVYLKSGEKGMLIYALMMVGLKDVPLDRLFKIGLVTWTAAFGGLILLNFTGILESPFVVHNKLGMGMIIRWGLGYSHPNVLHISYAILVAFFLYVLDWNRKNLLFATAAAFAGNCFIFLYSVSFTGLLLTTVYLILNFYFQFRSKFSAGEKILIQSVLPASVLFSLFAPLLPDGALFTFLNKLLNTRLRLSRHFLTTEPITLFGNRIVYEPGSDLTMDCSYVFAFVTYGLVLFILLMAGYFFLIRRYTREGKKKELAIIIGFLIVGISEPFLFNTSFKNLSLLFLGNYLFTLDFGKIHAVLGKTVCIFPQKWNCPCRRKKQCERPEGTRVHPLRLLLAGAVGAAVLGTGAFVIWREPVSVFVPQEVCDYWKGDEWVMTEALREEAENSGKQVLGFQEGAVFYEFGGNLIRLEKIRTWAGWAAIGAGIGMGTIAAVSRHQKQVPKRRR